MSWRERNLRLRKTVSMNNSITSGRALARATAYAQEFARRYYRADYKRACPPIVPTLNNRLTAYAKWCACALVLLTPGSFLILLPLWLGQRWRASGACLKNAGARLGTTVTLSAASGREPLFAGFADWITSTQPTRKEQS